MAATSGYQAGTEANAAQWSYGIESAWGSLPAIAFQAIRFNSETLGLVKTRQRPNEINNSREVSFAVTTQQVASGTLNYSLSYGTFDDFFAIAVGNEWQALQTIAGIAADITITAGSPPVLSSTLSTKFQNISQGQWIKLLGFTNAANNGIWYVSVKTDNSHLSLLSPRTAVTETPTGTLAQVRASTIKNSTEFRSAYLQCKFASNLFLRYPGAFVSRFTLQGGIGQFLTGGIDIIAQSETNATTDASTGAVTAAPTGRVHDPVVNFGGVFWNQAALTAPVDQFTFTAQNNGAAAEFALGSQTAQGMLQGMFEANATFRGFFKTFTEYTNFVNETSGMLTIHTSDSAGNSYVISLINAVLLAKIDAGGPNQPVYASFTVEGDPAAGGGTLVIDRLAGS